jgi:uncharacterized membrane protein YozB (DUF420 family)
VLVLGLVLILLAVAALVAAVGGGADDSAAYHVGSLHWDPSTMTVFLVGAATTVVLVIGLELLRSGIRRAHRRRKASAAGADAAAPATSTAPDQTPAGPTTGPAGRAGQSGTETADEE